MHKYVTEFIGTFFLVFSIGLAVVQELPMAPLAIGATLMVMVFMGGHISGAHYNPAVSLAILICGKMSAKDFVPYLVSQLAGAIAAALVVWVVLGSTFAPTPGASPTSMPALIVETLYTFALGLVVLNVATATATQGNSFYGLAIGFTIVAAAFAGGAISGGAFNPAVGTGPTIIHAVLGDGTWNHLWLYLVGPFLGGALAAGVFRYQQSACEEAAADS